MIHSLFHKAIFVDFEASSLDRLSNPIEIGLSRIQDGALDSWSTLIRPDPLWASDWSLQSQEVHRIKKSELEGAPPASEVAREVLSRIQGRIVISDAPEYDQRWLDRLLDLVGSEGLFSIQDFDNASFTVFSGYALDMLYEHLERRKSPHRAGPDSARLATAWLAARKFTP